MVRIAYFGTDGCPGHYAIPIRGKFTEEDIKVIESVDCDDFYKVFDVMRFKIAEFKDGRYWGSRQAYTIIDLEAKPLSS